MTPESSQRHHVEQELRQAAAVDANQDASQCCSEKEDLLSSEMTSQMREMHSGTRMAEGARREKIKDTRDAGTWR